MWGEHHVFPQTIASNSPWIAPAPLCSGDSLGSVTLLALPSPGLIWDQTVKDLNGFPNWHYLRVMTGSDLDLQQCNRWQRKNPEWSGSHRSAEASLRKVQRSHSPGAVLFFETITTLVYFWFFILFYFILFIYFWLCWVFVAVRGLFSSCSKRGLLFIAVHGLLIAVASLVAEHGL